MNETINLSDVTFTYPGRENPAIEDINFTVSEGERVLVAGPSGSGKTTLLKCLNGLIPHFSGGNLKGELSVGGLDPSEKSIREMANIVGMVFQDPENQITMTTVENEVAFGLENMGLPVPEIQARINEALEKTGTTHLRDREIKSLSCGEKQKTVIASVYALKPKIFVLDEPTSQLDPESAQDILSLLNYVIAESGSTVVLSEHRLGRVFPFVDRVYDMGDGGFIGKDDALDKYFGAHPKRGGEVEKGSGVVEVSGLCFGYGGEDVLRDVSLKIFGQEFVAVVGRNGSGKTTLVKHLNGLLKPRRGSVRILGEDISKKGVEEMSDRVGYVSQNPNEYLFCKTVREELSFTLDNLGVGGDIDNMLKRMHLNHLSEKHPLDLSSGERQRTALASILIAEPEIIILDEPTRGLDWKTKTELVSLLNKLRSAGKTIIVVTHDMHLVAESADRVIKLKRGRVIFDGPADKAKKEGVFTGEK